MSALETSAQDTIGFIDAHPPYEENYSCSEHAAGLNWELGDVAGTDCLITRLIRGPNGGKFSAFYKNTGKKNSDWFSDGAWVLSPISGTVIAVIENNTENKPGQLGKPPAGLVRIRAETGAIVVIAHIENHQFQKGDRVEAGERIGQVHNNGPSRAPHVHIGAFIGDEPLQIRFDLNAKKRVVGY